MKRQGIFVWWTELTHPAWCPSIYRSLVQIFTPATVTSGCVLQRVRPSSMSAPTTASIFVPLSISHGANASRTDRSRHEWSLTGQGQPILLRICAFPAAIEWMAAQMPGGWPAIMKRNRYLAQWASSFVESALGWKPLAPASMVGSMAS